MHKGNQKNFSSPRKFFGIAWEETTAMDIPFESAQQNIGR